MILVKTRLTRIYKMQKCRNSNVVKLLDKITYSHHVNPQLLSLFLRRNFKTDKC